ncbi:MAG: hypothetical protein MJZ13_07485 [Bacteroidales bacterium]|nr:hypothetical protein [Bacteroidales bacterium]
MKKLFLFYLASLTILGALSSCSNDDEIDEFEYINEAVGSYTFSTDAVVIENNEATLVENVTKGTAKVTREGKELRFAIDGDTDVFVLNNCIEATDKSCFFYRVANGKSDDMEYTGHNFFQAKLSSGGESLYHGYYNAPEKEITFFITANNVIMKIDAFKK